jgi:hypothetical protein
MAEASDQILSHIEAQRAQLAKHVGELETHVRKTVDWRVQLQRNPALAVGIGLTAFALLIKLIGKD